MKPLHPYSDEYATDTVILYFGDGRQTKVSRKIRVYDI